jgi:hypothetical protein
VEIVVALAAAYRCFWEGPLVAEDTRRCCVEHVPARRFGIVACNRSWEEPLAETVGLDSFAEQHKPAEAEAGACMHSVVEAAAAAVEEVAAVAVAAAVAAAIEDDLVEDTCLVGFEE